MFIRKYKDKDINPYALPGLLNDYKMNLQPTMKDYNLDRFIEVISTKTGVSEKNIKSKSREKEFVFARHVFCYLAKKYTGHTLKAIGQYINRDHTSIIHAIQTMNNEMRFNVNVRSQITDIEAELPFAVKGLKGNPMALAYEVVKDVS